MTIDGPVILPVGDENDYATYTTVNIIISGENIISAEGVPLQGGDSVYLMEDEPAEGNATNSLLLDNEMQGVVSDVDGIVAHRPKVERYLEISDGTNLVQGGAFPGADENPSITYISKQQSTLKCTYGKIPDGKYVLTVYEGTGAGTYAAGETVPISCPDEISMETGEAGETVKCPFICLLYTSRCV